MILSIFLVPPSHSAPSLSVTIWFLPLVFVLLLSPSLSFNFNLKLKHAPRLLYLLLQLSWAP